MYMVMKEAPVSRDALEELEKDGVHYFDGIADISRESDPMAGLDLDDELGSLGELITISKGKRIIVLGDWSFL